MKSIYISLGASNKLLNKIVQMTGNNPGYAGHKFGKLLIKGFEENGIDMSVLSAIAMNRTMSKKIFWNLGKEEEDGIHFKYIPFINLPIIHSLCVITYTFFYVLFWGCCNKRNKFAFIDVINTGLCVGALIASKINGLRLIGCMTDMPGLMVESSTLRKERSFYASISRKICQTIMNKFDAYVFLTPQMNKDVNTRNKSYIIMEGLVDINFQSEQNVIATDADCFTFFYAGGLHKRYGLGMLVDAFCKLPYDNCKLVLYGSGPYVEELSDICLRDKRVQYRGIAPNEVVVKEELKATVLVNPRPTNEEFTKYSFPSKNMEYMVSGRPLLTTNLPGMPEEYHDYVYLFNEESTDGYYKTLKRLYLTPQVELNKKGEEAQKWVLKNKNNVVQTERIKKLIMSLNN